MHVAIIGAGWYGCHIACELRRDGHAVEVFDSGIDVFSGASGHTQNRLHVGFHYPRSALTRRQTWEGYQRFKRRYPTFSSPIEQNLYAVASNDSLLDADTYQDVMTSARLPFEVVGPRDYRFVNVSRLFRVPEELLRTEVARQSFRRELASVLNLQTPVSMADLVDGPPCIGGRTFDVAVDCTWGASGLGERWPGRYFEPCITLIYERTGGPAVALTVVDGKFFSLYPYQRDLFTLTSVEYTPLGRCPTHREAQRVLDEQSIPLVEGRRIAMERAVRAVFPEFPAQFCFQGASFAIKTKLPDACDARVSTVHRQGRLLTVMSGKVDAIFFASDRVRELLDDIAGARRPLAPDRPPDLPCEF